MAADWREITLRHKLLIFFNNLASFLIDVLFHLRQKKACNHQPSLPWPILFSQTLIAPLPAVIVEDVIIYISSLFPGSCVNAKRHERKTTIWIREVKISLWCCEKTGIVRVWTAWSTALSSQDAGVRAFVWVHLHACLQYQELLRATQRELKSFWKNCSGIKTMTWKDTKEVREKAAQSFERSRNDEKGGTSQWENKGGKRGRCAMCCTPEPWENEGEGGRMKRRRWSRRRRRRKVGDDGRESVPLHAHYHLFIWKTSLHRYTAG